MKNLIKLIFLITFFNFSLVNAQINDTLEIQRNDKGIVQFVLFKVNENSNRKMQNDTSFLKSILNSKKDDKFNIILNYTDLSGVTHKKFQQYYQGVKVDHGELLIHGKNGNIDAFNGNYININIPSVNPYISENKALGKALLFVGAKKYNWEDSTMENFIKQRINDPNATYYPKGELVILNENFIGKNVSKLAWKYQISSLLPFNKQMIYVDADSGNVISSIPLICDAYNNTTLTAQTLYSDYNGYQTITGDNFSSGSYRLRETRKCLQSTVDIQTLNLNNSFNTSSTTDFINSSTNWTNGNWSTFNQNQCVLDAHFGAEKVLDFWGSVFSRYSINGNGLTILGYAHAGLSWNNAQWNPAPDNYMFYGDGDGITFSPLTALDVCAHELGHGIDEYTANLTPGNSESGALNEGLSDIWGACVEHWAAPNDPNKQTWLIGEQVMKNGAICLRSLRSPKTEGYNGNTNNLNGGYPNTYKGQYWDPSLEPHINSTVLSHCFYLLSQGGSGTNDLGNSYSVFGIGINSAQNIIYSMESNYLTSSAQYSDARNAMILAASFLYNSSSFEVMQVKNAWYAVGLGAQPTQVSISGNLFVCSSGAAYTVNNLPSSSSVTWTQSGNISYISGQNTNSYNVVASGSGNGWIQATINGTITLPQYAVKVGAPNYIGIVSFNNLTEVDQFDFKILSGTGNYPYEGNLTMNDGTGLATNYQWTEISQSGVTGFTSNQGYVDVWAKSVNSSLSLKLTASNSCGSYSQYYYFTPGNIQPQIIISPNPASDNVNVMIIPTVNSTDTTSASQQNLLSTQNDNNNSSLTSYNVTILSLAGITYYSNKQYGNNFTLSVSNLPNGSYIIYVTDGTNSYSNKLIIKH